MNIYDSADKYYEIPALKGGLANGTPPGPRRDD